MLLTIYIGFALICLVSGFARIRKPVPALCAILFLLILSMGIYGESDLINYTNTFNTLVNWGAVFRQEEWLFWSVAYIVKMLGGDIYSFKLVVLIATVIFLWLGLRDYCWNWNLLTGLFMCFEAFWVIIQWRFFLAEAMFIFALRYLMPANKSPLKYMVLVFASSLVHTSLILALLFLLVNLKSKKLLTGCIAAISLVSLAVVVANPDILSAFVTAVGGERMEQYSVARGSGWVLCAWLFLITVLVSGYCTSHAHCLRNETYIQDYAAGLNLITLISVIALPFCVISIEFYRYYRLLLLPLFAVSTNYMGKCSYLRTDIYLLIIILFILIISWDIVSFNLVSDFDKSFMVIFENNMLA